LIQRRAAKAGREIALASRPCEGAFGALMSGDAAKHDAMRGANDKQVAVAVGARSVAAKTLVQHLLHAPFALNPLHRVMEEILVKRDAGMRVPPGGVQHHIHRQHFILKIGVPVILLCFYTGWTGWFSSHDPDFNTVYLRLPRQ
jgi:hypothetical protein